MRTMKTARFFHDKDSVLQPLYNTYELAEHNTRAFRQGRIFTRVCVYILPLFTRTKLVTDKTVMG